MNTFFKVGDRVRFYDGVGRPEAKGEIVEISKSGDLLIKPDDGRRIKRMSEDGVTRIYDKKG